MPTTRRSALVAAAAVCVALLVPRASRADGEAPAEGAAAVVWDREGYAAILDAAAHAKAKGRRLLLGLFGSPT